MLYIMSITFNGIISNQTTKAVRSGGRFLHCRHCNTAMFWRTPSNIPALFWV